MKRSLGFYTLTVCALVLQAPLDPMVVLVWGLPVVHWVLQSVCVTDHPCLAGIAGPHALCRQKVSAPSWLLACGSSHAGHMSTSHTKQSELGVLLNSPPANVLKGKRKNSRGI